MAKVSVVIPIYNAQPYLRQCLDSIRAQSFRDIEVLCVNDGSTDDSLEVMREYAAADPRFIVLDKPNGGYGHSLNYGIAHATGEFVSIIEPDDFIHGDMYGDLLAFADFGGEPADIVKGSYWEFFDGRDGFDDLVVRPNLAAFMKQVPYAFKLEEDTTVIEHHPSIWSAIYRRSFLERNDIRFVEPKGAGWADNPFLFETLIAAERIVWVPKGYYYYRQTNPSASSFLKDYRMPFDRLRDIRKVLRERDASEDVQAAFYQRSFFYIDSIIGEFGFDEGDEELQQLIYEALSAMNPDIVRTHPKILSRHIAYYDERMALNRSLGDEGFSSGEAAAESDDAPIITYVVPAGNDAEHAEAALAALASQPIENFEALIVDCGSRDRTYDICSHVAAVDRRFKWLDTHGLGNAAALNQALEQARGHYVIVLGLEHRLHDAHLARVLLGAAECDVDIMLLDELGRFAVDALNASGCVEPYAVIGDEAWPGLISKPFSADAAASFALNCSWPNHCLTLYNTRFLRDSGARFKEEGVASVRCLLADALLKANRVAYAFAPFLEVEFPSAETIPCVLDIRDWRIAEKPLITPAALELSRDSQLMERFGQSVRNLVLDAFSYDLTQRRTEASVKEFFEGYFRQVEEVVDQGSSSDYHDGEPFEDYQIIKNKGLDSYIMKRYLVRERDASASAKALSEVVDSRTYRLGTFVKEAVMRVLPRRALANIRGSIASKAS